MPRDFRPCCAALLLALASACATGSTPERFGAPLVSSLEPVPVAELLAALERFDGTTLVLAGKVNAVCAKKGCWMTLTAGEREMRVTFQDYGFFVPLDASGAGVRAEGTFHIEETPVEEARHYLEDAGKHAEAAAITSPVLSYTFVATGVELTR
jgi:hypothetical protein